MKNQRKHYTPEEKVGILRRHLVEGVPISDLCDELGLQACEPHFRGARRSVAPHPSAVEGTKQPICSRPLVLSLGSDPTSPPESDLLVINLTATCAREGLLASR